MIKQPLHTDETNMNLIRLIVSALIIYLLLRIVKNWNANKKSTTSTPGETKMVRCKVCQLHIPENEALQNAGDYYCSQEHLEEK